MSKPVDDDAKAKKHRHNKSWMQEHVNDHYVQRAKAEGWRSRAAFKLIELDEKGRLLKPGMTVVDLGSAPGSWSQVVSKRLGGRGRILALDILPMDPVPGVEFIQGDFREAEVFAALENMLQGHRADLVLSDMAPNISGVDAADQAGSIGLAELALEFAKARLKPTGALVIKLFQGEGFEDFVRSLRQSFTKVELRKPKASRPRSREMYSVARGLRVV